MKITVKTSGLNSLQRRLRQMEAGARRLHGRHEVRLSELLHPGFMRRHTQFGTLEEMLAESEWAIESAEDFKAIPDGPWDTYVRQTTRFRSWTEMHESAAREWMRKKAKKELGL